MSSPVEMFGTQDLSDDDGQVIDSFFKETDAPPNLKLAVENIPVLEVVKPPNPTRIFAGFLIFTATTEAFQLFQPDVNRVMARVRVTSLNATPDASQFVYVAESKSLVTFPDAAPRSGLAFRMRHGHTYDLDEHTGGLWIAGNPAIQTEGIEVTWILTSKQP